MFSVKHNKEEKISEELKTNNLKINENNESIISEKNSVKEKEEFTYEIETNKVEDLKNFIKAF